MVKELLTYIGRVLKRSVTGTFVVVDIVGVVLLVLSLNQPKVPILVSVLVFLAIIMFSSFLVWRDAEKEHEQLRNKITALRNGIPKYKVEAGAFERYSIAGLIDRTTKELEQVQAKLRPAPSTSITPASDAFAAAFKTLSQFSISLPRVMGMGAETLEEKEERLAKYLGELEEFEDKLKTTYQIPLFFEATRSDGNIELEIEPSPECELIVEDDYVKSNLPRSYTPSLYGSHNFAALSAVPSGGFANRLYPYSYAKAGIGYSKLNKINASQKYRVFDEDFYIRSDSEKVELKITVHSEKINEPQIITLALDLKGVEADEIEQHSDEDDE